MHSPELDRLVEDIEFGLNKGGGQYGYLSKLTPTDRRDFYGDLEAARKETLLLVEAGALKAPKDIIDHVMTRLQDKLAVYSAVAAIRPAVPHIYIEDPDPHC